MNIYFKKNLKSLRILSGKSQQEIAAVFNVPRTTYSGWENNEEANPDLPALVSIAKHYRITLDALITEDICKKIINQLKNL